MSPYDSQDSDESQYSDQNKLSSKTISYFRSLFGFDQMSPEYVVNFVFESQNYNKISYSFFRMKMEELCEDLNISNENINELFKTCELKQDGFLHPEDFGQIMEILCQIEINQDDDDYLIKEIYNGINVNKQSQIEIQDIENYFKKTFDSQKAFQEANRFMNAIDKHNKGYLIYWDFFINKKLPNIKELIQI